MKKYQTLFGALILLLALSIGDVIAQEPDPGGLVLWNKLGSQEEIENSAIGLNGTESGGSFVAGVFGNAYYSDYTENYLVTFPKEVIPLTAGTIEFWAKLYNPPVRITSDVILASIHGGNAQYTIMLNDNDGDGNGGLIGKAGRWYTCGTGSYGWWTYEQVLGTGQVEEWHHYALVWDENGITGIGDGTHKVATFINGQHHNNRYYVAIDEGFPNFLNTDISLNLIINYSSQAGVALDNLIIWNQALTDFSHRFIESPCLSVETYAEQSNLCPVNLSFDSMGVLYAGNNLSNIPIWRVGVGGAPIEPYGDPIFDPDAVVIDKTGSVASQPGSVLVGSGGGLGYTAVYEILPDETTDILFQAGLSNPQDMVFDDTGRLLIADAFRHAVLQTTGSAPTVLFSQRLANEVAVDGNGQVFTGSPSGIQIHDRDGNLINGSFVTGYDIVGLDFSPTVSPFWNGDLVAISRDGILLRVDVSGTAMQIRSGFAGMPGYESPDVAFGPDSTLYVAATSHDTIYRIVPDSDGDGIQDEVDAKPFVHSRLFSDQALGGMTGGRILGLDAGITILIRDDLDRQKGLRVRVSGPAGGEAKIKLDGSKGLYKLVPGEYILTSGSVTLKVLEGTAVVEFTISGESVVVSVEGTVIFEELIVEEELQELIVNVVEGNVTVNDQVLPPDERFTIMCVSIDIKPGSDSNCLNSNGYGVIPVAILSSTDFDATQVDPTTVSLDGQLIRVVGKGKAQAHIEDANSNGVDDLVVQVENEAETYQEGDTVGTLTGKTFRGTFIVGTDTICIVP